MFEPGDLFALVPFVAGCVFYGWLSWAFGIDRTGDSWNFFHQAWSIYRPDVPDSLSTVQPHGYPAFLLLRLLCGFQETTFASAMNALFMGGIGAIAFLLLRRVLPRGVALGGAFVLMFSKPSLYVGNWAMPEASSILLLTVALFLLVQYALRSRSGVSRGLWVLAFGGGLALGLGAWMRYAALIWLPCGLLWIALCGWLAKRPWQGVRHAVLAGVPGVAFVACSMLFAFVESGGKIHGTGSGYRPDAIVPAMKAIFLALREDVFGPVVTAYPCHHAVDPAWMHMGFAARLDALSWLLMGMTAIAVGWAFRRLMREPDLRGRLAPYGIFAIIVLATPPFLWLTSVTTEIELPTARYCTAYYPALYLILTIAFHLFVSDKGPLRRVRVRVVTTALLLFVVFQASWTAAYVTRAARGTFAQCEAAGWKRDKLVAMCRDYLRPDDDISGNVSPVLCQMIDNLEPGWQAALAQRSGKLAERMIAVYEYNGFPRFEGRQLEAVKAKFRNGIPFETDKGFVVRLQ